MDTDQNQNQTPQEPKQTPSGPTPASPRGPWTGWLLFGALSGVLAFDFELVVLLLTERAIWSSPGTLGAVAMMLGAALALALPFSAACAVAFRINGFKAPPADLVATSWSWLTDREPATAAHRVSLLGSVGAGMTFALVVSSVAIATLGNPFAQSTYNAILHAAAALVAVGVSTIVGRAAYLFRRRILQSGIDAGKAWTKPFRTPARAMGLLLALAVLAGAAGASILLGRGLTPNVVYGAVAALLALAGALPVLLFRVVRERSPATKWWSRLVPAALILGLIGLGFGAGTTASRSLVARTGVLTSPVIRVLRGLTDFDSDGYSGLFGGGDCAPNDPAISPGVRDIIDNGIDENCNGADFTSSSVIPAPEPAFVEDHGLCAPNGCDFVLITIDSLRSDRLGAYTPGVELTPTLDALSDAGTRFDNAYCLGPGTILTVPQLFSVVHDTQLQLDWSRAREIGPRPLTEDNLLFPEVLADAGYSTGGIAGHFYLEPLRYGFQIYENRREHWTSNQEITSPRVTETAIEMYDQLAAAPEPFFQWVHYYDPHHDYMPHEEGAESWNDHDRYDAEVRFTDEWVGRFVDHVEAHPRERPLVWVITADHGEGLGDHGIRYHNRNFYDELCRIPLIFVVPGTEPRVIDGPVSLHDIGATLLNLAGLPAEPRFEGRSLIDSIASGAENPDRLVFHQAVYEQGGVDYEIFGVSNSEWRLFWDRLNGTVELYDAVEDRREETNLELQLPDVRNQLLESLEGFLRRVEP